MAQWRIIIEKLMDPNDLEDGLDHGVILDETVGPWLLILEKDGGVQMRTRFDDKFAQFGRLQWALDLAHDAIHDGNRESDPLPDEED